MTRYWFRPKRYGYGATPVTWEGWALTLATPLAMVAVSLGLGLGARSDWARAALVAFDVAALALLFQVSRRKTEGEWGWRWGAGRNQTNIE